MSTSLATRPLHHRHRLSGRARHAYPPRARQCQWAPARGDRQRVRRCRDRRRDPEGLRRRRLPRGEHRRARQWLPVLHRRRRVRAGARPDSRARTASRAHRHRNFGACSAETSGPGLPLARDQEPRDVDGVVAIIDGAALAEGQVAADLAALSAQRTADPALDHDDPIEEVFEDQIACADLVVLNKRDLLDAPGIDKAVAVVAGALPRAVRSSPWRTARSIHGAARARRRRRSDIENRRTRHDLETGHDHDDFNELRRGATRACRSRGAHRAHRPPRRGAQGAAHEGLRRGRRQDDAPSCQAVGPRVSHYYDRPWRRGRGATRESSLWAERPRSRRGRRTSARVGPCICFRPVGDLDDTVEPRDLGRPRRHSDPLFCRQRPRRLAAAYAAEKGSLPSLRLAHLRDLRHPMSIDLSMTRSRATPRSLS